MNVLRLRIALFSLLAITFLAVLAFPQVAREWRRHQENQLANQCRQAASLHRWDELKVLVERWTSQNPSSGEGWMLRGRAAIGRGEWSEAADSFSKVPDWDPQAVAALAEATQLRFRRLNDPLKGAETLERILRINPKAAEAHQQLIGFYAATLQRQKLAKQIRAAIAAQCEPPEAYAYDFLLFTLRDNNTVSLNARWLKEHPEEEIFLVSNFLLRPELAVQDSSSASMSTASSPSYPESESVSDKKKQVDVMLQRFPQNIELLAYQANLCIVTGDVRRGAEILAQAPASAGTDARFWRLEGWIHESNQEFDKAISAYHRGLELHAVDWNTMIRLSVVERRKQNLAEVKRLTALVERALELRRDLRKDDGSKTPSPAILGELAQYYRDCGEKTVGPALERRIGGRSVR